MIAGVIRWSIHNRFLVLVLTALVTAWGIYSLRQTPVDALPDLSDVQVIIKTSFPGQAPQVVEDQVIPFDDGNVGRTESDHRSWLLVLRGFVCLHHLRGWNRSLLGKVSRA